MEHHVNGASVTHRDARYGGRLFLVGAYITSYMRVDLLWVHSMAVGAASTVSGTAAMQTVGESEQRTGLVHAAHSLPP